MNERSWHELREVNDYVERHVTYLKPETEYGRYLWKNALANGKGNCAAYAIAKGEMLMARGWEPSTELRFTWVTAEAPSDHMVLAAKLDDGWYILDNRHPGDVLRADLTEYAGRDDGFQIWGCTLDDWAEVRLA